MNVCNFFNGGGDIQCGGQQVRGIARLHRKAQRMGARDRERIGFDGVNTGRKLLCHRFQYGAAFHFYLGIHHGCIGRKTVQVERQGRAMELGHQLKVFRLCIRTWSPTGTRRLRGITSMVLATVGPGGP